jgi:hypothetical protein
MKLLELENQVYRTRVDELEKEVRYLQTKNAELTGCPTTFLSLENQMLRARLTEVETEVRHLQAKNEELTELTKSTPQSGPPIVYVVRVRGSRGSGLTYGGYDYAYCSSRQQAEQMIANYTGRRGLKIQLRDRAEIPSTATLDTRCGSGYESD